MSFVYELPPSDTVKLDKIVLRIEGSRNTNEEREEIREITRRSWNGRIGRIENSIKRRVTSSLQESHYPRIEMFRVRVSFFFFFLPLFLLSKIISRPVLSINAP